jgi:hypothetical protein
VSFTDGGERFPENRVIKLSHELTAEHGFVAVPGDDIDATAEGILNHPEIARIASRPGDLQHGVLLGRLRMIAMGWKWEPDALGSIGSVLRSVGVISESEEDWLRSAGAAWSEAPRPKAERQPLQR